MFTIIRKRQGYHKLIALVTASFFFLNVFTSDVLALAPELRTKPFSEATKLEFETVAKMMSAAGEIRSLIEADNARENPMIRLELNKRYFPNGEVEIDNVIHPGSFKCSGRVYDYALFHFKKENKTIKAIFIRDYDKLGDKDKLTDDELAELGVKTAEDLGHFSQSREHPALKGVWFVNLRNNEGQADGMPLAQFLQGVNIPFELIKVNPRGTEVQDAFESLREVIPDIKLSQILKTLVFKDTQGKLHVFILPEDKYLDMQRAGQLMGTGSRMAEDVESIMGYPSGQVSPIMQPAVRLNDHREWPTVRFDSSFQGLLNSPAMFFMPSGVPEYKIGIRLKDLARVIRLRCGVGPFYAKISSAQKPADSAALRQLATAERGKPQTAGEDVSGGEGRGAAPRITGFVPKVHGEAVGILRIIPDIENNHKKLFAIKDNEIAAVDYYPTSDPTMSCPAAILTTVKTAFLTHAEVRARFWGIPHAVAPSLDSLKAYDGKRVYLKVSGEGVELRPATEKETADYAAYKKKKPAPKLAEVDLTVKENILDYNVAFDPRQVSHKFASLHAIRGRSFPALDREPVIPVHGGPVIPYAAFKRVLDANPGVETRIKIIASSIDNSDKDDIENKLVMIRDLIENMEIPASVWGDAEEYKRRGLIGPTPIDYIVKRVAGKGRGLYIRTGTNAEDLPEYSGFGAGQYGTFPNIMPKDAKAFVKRAWASVWNTGAYIERQKLGIDHLAVYPAVQITEAIDAEYAFIAHTAEPNGTDQDKVMIEIAQGLAEWGYPGDPHRYVYSKSKDAIIDFRKGDRKKKAVLDPRGGLATVDADDSRDIFVCDGMGSELALRIARAAVLAEKRAGRPQDIEGAIGRPDTHEWCLIQSRSQVGYGALPTPWDEYVKANRKWAEDFIARNAGDVSRRVPTMHFKQEIDTLYGTRDIPAGIASGMSVEMANRMRCVASMTGVGGAGVGLAGMMLKCGSGIHRQSKEAFELLPPDIRAAVMERAATDYEALDLCDIAAFEAISNYNIVRIIFAQSVDGLKGLFSALSPRALAMILAEVTAFEAKTKDLSETSGIKVPWREIYRIAREVHSGYGAEKRGEFERHLTLGLSTSLGIPLRDKPYIFSAEEREALFDVRYVPKPQAVVLSAAAIDGCPGLGSYFDIMEFSFKQNGSGRYPKFFLIMDTDGSRADFLRRNGLTGRNFEKIFEPGELTGGTIAGAIRKILIGDARTGDQVGGDEIAVVGPEEAVARYVTADNNAIGIVALPQRGKIPAVISDAIKAIADRHESKEARFSAWLVSRGLDGAARYPEYVYEAERFLEAYERASALKKPDPELYVRFGERLKEYDTNKTTLKADEFDRSIDHMFEKNASAASEIILNAAALLWAKSPSAAVLYNRTLGFKRIRRIAENLPAAPAGESGDIARARVFFVNESIFPRNAGELEELIAGAKAGELETFVGNVYRYYVVGGADGAGLPRKEAEKAVAAGFCRNTYVSSEYGSGLTNIHAGHPEWIEWLAPLMDSYGGGYEIVTADQLSRDGSPNAYRMRAKPSERERRAAARRERRSRGEDIDESGLADEDFESWALDAARKFVSFFCGPNDARRREEFRQTYYPADFVFYLSHVGISYRELAHAQDVVEAMYREDDGYTARAVVMPEDEEPLASITLCLYAIFDPDASSGASIVLKAAPPKLISDMVHYAAQAKTNIMLGEYLREEPSVVRSVLEELINEQNPARKSAIERDLSPQARAFLHPDGAEKSTDAQPAQGARNGPQDKEVWEDTKALTKHPEFSFAAKNENGVILQEPCGFPGEWTVEIDKTVSLGSSEAAAVQRLVKSFSLSAVSSDRLDCMKAKFHIVKELEGDGYKIAPSNTYGLEIMVAERFLSFGLSKQRDIFGDAMKGKAIIPGRITNIEKPQYNFTGRKLKVLIFNDPAGLNEWGVNSATSRYASTFILASFFKNRGDEARISDIKYNNHDDETLRREIAGIDMVCMSVFDGTIEDIGLLISKIKKIKPEIVVALGGPTVTVSIEHAMAFVPEANIFYRGDIEAGFEEVLRSGERNGVSAHFGNAYYFHDIISINRMTADELNARNIDFSVLTPERLKGVFGIMTSLGCPYRCIFCATSSGKKFRAMSPQRVVEVVKAYEKHLLDLEAQGAAVPKDAWKIQFSDDNFFTDKERAVEILRLMSEAKLRVKLITLQGSVRSFLMQKEDKKGLEIDKDFIKKISQFSDVFENRQVCIYLGTDAQVDSEIARLRKPAYNEKLIEEVLAEFEKYRIDSIHYLIMTNPETRLKDILRTYLRAHNLEVKYPHAKLTVSSLRIQGIENRTVPISRASSDISSPAALIKNAFLSNTKRKGTVLIIDEYNGDREIDHGVFERMGLKAYTLGKFKLGLNLKRFMKTGRLALPDVIITTPRFVEDALTKFTKDRIIVIVEGGESRDFGKEGFVTIQRREIRARYEPGQDAYKTIYGRTKGYSGPMKGEGEGYKFDDKPELRVLVGSGSDKFVPYAFSVPSERFRTASSVVDGETKKSLYGWARAFGEVDGSDATAKVLEDMLDMPLGDENIIAERQKIFSTLIADGDMRRSLEGALSSVLFEGGNEKKRSIFNCHGELSSLEWFVKENFLKPVKVPRWGYGLAGSEEHEYAESKIAEWCEKLPTLISAIKALDEKLDPKDSVYLKQIKNNLKLAYDAADPAGLTAFIDILREASLIKAGRPEEFNERMKPLRQKARGMGVVRTLTYIEDAAKYLYLFVKLSDHFERSGWAKPEMTPEEADKLDIEDGWNPLVNTDGRDLSEGEAAAKLIMPKEIVKNSFHLDKDKNMLMITGPNMDGKSVAIETALWINALAQMGFYVPAKKASFSMRKKIIHRAPRSGSIAHGLSSFGFDVDTMKLVKKEAAKGVLLGIDELGRNTNAIDGSSLAFAVLKAAIESGASAIVATHFHELTELGADKRVENMHMDYRVLDNGDVELKCKLVPGPGESKALAIAKALGMPEDMMRAAEARFNDRMMRYRGENPSIEGNPAYVLERLEQKETEVEEPVRLGTRKDMFIAQRSFSNGCVLMDKATRSSLDGWDRVIEDITNKHWGVSSLIKKMIDGPTTDIGVIKERQNVLIALTGDDAARSGIRSALEKLTSVPFGKNTIGAGETAEKPADGEKPSFEIARETDWKRFNSHDNAFHALSWVLSNKVNRLLNFDLLMLLKSGGEDDDGEEQGKDPEEEKRIAENLNANLKDCADMFDMIRASFMALRGSIEPGKALFLDQMRNSLALIIDDPRGYEPMFADMRKLSEENITSLEQLSGRLQDLSEKYGEVASDNGRSDEVAAAYGAGNRSVRFDLLKDAAAYLECFVVLSDYFLAHGWTRPDVRPREDEILDIVDGWQPSLEVRYEWQEKITVVKNSLRLDKDKMVMLITGSNMDGKSTSMQMAAMIQAYAQAGLFVPAASCTASVVDGIIHRTPGRGSIEHSISSFGEDIEAAKHIALAASPSVLVFMDEPGRSTNPGEGDAVAWAITKKIIESGARGVVITHFEGLHQMKMFPEVKFAHVEVRRAENGDITLTYKLLPGADVADGIEIAEYMELQPSIVAAARIRREELRGKMTIYDGSGVSGHSFASSLKSGAGDILEGSTQSRRVSPSLSSEAPGRPQLIAKEESDRIHAENMKRENMPAIETKTDKEMLCHIITDSILPAEQPYSQRKMLKESIDQAMDKENKHIERVAALSGDNAGDPDKYIEDLRALIKKKQDLYASLGYTKVRFTLACPDVKLVDKVLGSGIGIKALAFEPCDTSRFNLVQVEGIMLALRVLDSGDLVKLKSVYAFLAKHALSPEDATITDINTFIRKVAFILPAAKVEDYELKKTLHYLAHQIWQAA